MCKSESTLKNLALSCQDLNDPVHSRCMEALCQLTRFPGNNEILASSEDVQEALRVCGGSVNNTDRLWTVRALQNITAYSSKSGTFISSEILKNLCSSAEKLDFVEEHETAISVIGNLCTNPVGVVQVTNTENVMRILVTVAHSVEYFPEIQFVACDAIATIAVWMQRMASAGSVPEGYSFAPLPSLKSTGYMRYNTNE